MLGLAGHWSRVYVVKRSLADRTMRFRRTTRRKNTRTAQPTTLKAILHFGTSELARLTTEVRPVVVDMMVFVQHAGAGDDSDPTISRAEATVVVSFCTSGPEGDQVSAGAGAS